MPARWFSRPCANAPALKRCRSSEKFASSTGNAMSKPSGLLTLDELDNLIKQDEVETVVVGFTDHYGRLLGKRCDAEMFVNETAAHGTHGCNYLLTTDMEMQPVPGYRFANWQQGYGDFHLVPDLSTLAVASWLDKT